MDIQPLQEVPIDLSGGVSSPDEVDKEGVRYKVLTYDEAQALWDCGANHILRRTLAGSPHEWRDAEDANNSPNYLLGVAEFHGTFKWRIPIE